MGILFNRKANRSGVTDKELARAAAIYFGVYNDAEEKKFQQNVAVGVKQAMADIEKQKQKAAATANKTTTQEQPKKEPEQKKAPEATKKTVVEEKPKQQKKAESVKTEPKQEKAVTANNTTQAKPQEQSKQETKKEPEQKKAPEVNEEQTETVDEELKASVEVAKTVGVPEEEIIKDKDDLDKYFLGEGPVPDDLINDLKKIAEKEKVSFPDSKSGTGKTIQEKVDLIKSRVDLIEGKHQNLDEIQIDALLRFLESKKLRKKLQAVDYPAGVKLREVNPVSNNFDFAFMIPGGKIIEFCSIPEWNDEKHRWDNHIKTTDISQQIIKEQQEQANQEATAA